MGIAARGKNRRWVAIGAAVTAISMGALGAVQWAGAATNSPESVFVAIDPVRILDTRDGIDIGLDGPFATGEGQRLKVIGGIATTTGVQVVVPVDATGVSLNVTANRPTSAGFISVRPGGATGEPATSNLNFEAGVNLPNAVTVQLPTSGLADGTIEVFYRGAAGATTNILIDVVGYYTEATGGQPGTPGTPGTPAPSPSNIVWVAQSGGDYTGVQAAIDSITDESPSNPYVVKIAPGTYDGAISLPSYISLEGSGRLSTNVAAGGAPSASSDSAKAVVSIVGGSSVSDLTVLGAATSNDVIGVLVNGTGSDPLTELRNVRIATESQSGEVHGLLSEGAGTQIRLVDDKVEASGSGSVTGVEVEGAGTNLAMESTELTSSGDGIIVNVGADAQLGDVSLTAADDAVSAFSPSTRVDIADSDVTGGGRALYAAGDGEIDVRASRISGQSGGDGGLGGSVRLATSEFSGGTTSGSISCVYSYSPGNAELAFNCT